jgi:PAS domain S-box-containing protein
MMQALAQTSRASDWLAGEAIAPRLRPAVLLASLAAAYYLTAVAGHLLLTLPILPSLAILWTPNVLLLGVFLTTPVRLWPLVVLVAFAAQVAVAFTVPVPIGRSLGMFVGNLTQSLLGAIALRRLGDWREQFETLRGVTTFVAVAVIGAPAVASFLALFSLSALAWVDEPWLYWRVRFVTNVLSAIAVAPPLLVFLKTQRLPRPFARQALEMAALLLLLGLSERIATSIATPMTGAPLLFSLLPFLLWAAARFGAAGVGIALCFTALFRYFSDVHPAVTVEMAPIDAVVTTQLTLIAMGLPLLFLSALLAERRRGERELRTRDSRYGLATMAGAVGVWDWNLETDEIYVDPALKNLLGFSDAEIANHLDEWGKRVHADDGERVMMAAQAHIEGRAPAFEIAHRMVHKDGSLRWFLARGVVVERRDGRAVRMTGTDMDITTQKQTEQALQEARSELARLTRLSEMGGLTATIAHEVNQPLCAIVANASASLRWLGRDDPDMLQVRGALEDVVRDGNRASALIKRMRSLFERGAVERRPLDLNVIVNSAIALTQGSCDAHRIATRVTLDPALPTVRGDALQLQQVFCNLILNAVESMARTPAAPPVLRIATSRHDGNVYAEVVDSGAGLGEDPERIFQPLVTTRSGGMGIGLSMSRMIVEMHGGRLWATPNSDAGATFHVVLPRPEEHA